MNLQFFKNILFFHKVLNEAKEGYFVLDDSNKPLKLPTARGDIFEQNDEMFEKIIALFDKQELVFEERALQNSFLCPYNFHRILYLKSNAIDEATKNIFFQELLKENYIHSTKYALYKILSKAAPMSDVPFADLSIGYIFFTKGNYTFSDYLQNYKYKKKELLEKIVITLFLIGQITILETQNPYQQYQSSVFSNELRSLMNKLTSMQKTKI